MAPENRAYPVYRSPDGDTEQVAATPAREVQLKHAGWVKVRQPRRKTPKPTAKPTTNAPKPKQAAPPPE